MNVLTEPAPAKLNLSLYVGEQRDEDGLHELCSLFCPLSLADELTLEPAGGANDEVVCAGVEGPNLALEAISGFRERFGWKGEPVRITIDKRIPIAAGLGGGSADAAAALRLAIRTSGIEPAAAELVELAMSIGADVPSQLSPALQLVTGAGEHFEPIVEQLSLYAVLLAGRDQLSTADVYMHADSMFPGRSTAALAKLGDELRAAVAAAGGVALGLGQHLHNDLQGSAVALEPSAGEALDLMRGAGARQALVTGSGPTVFGLFEDAAAADAAADGLRGQWPADVLTATAASS